MHTFRVSRDGARLFGSGQSIRSGDPVGAQSVLGSPVLKGLFAPPHLVREVLLDVTVSLDTSDLVLLQCGWSGRNRFIRRLAYEHSSCVLYDVGCDVVRTVRMPPDVERTGRFRSIREVVRIREDEKHILKLAANLVWKQDDIRL